MKLLTTFVGFLFVMICLVWPATTGTASAAPDGTASIQGYDNNATVAGHDPPTLGTFSQLVQGNYIEFNIGTLTSLPAIPVTNGLVVYKITTATGPPRPSDSSLYHCPCSNRPYLPGGGAKAA